MLQQEEATDYVVGTGVTHTVQDLVELAFGRVGLDWQDYVVEDERFLRPAEVEQLRADASKARQMLGWEPTVDCQGLIHMMVDADLERLATEETGRESS